MQAAAQHLSPSFQAKSEINDHSHSTSLNSAYQVSRYISALSIIEAFPCGRKQP